MIINENDFLLPTSPNIRHGLTFEWLFMILILEIRLHTKNLHVTHHVESMDMRKIMTDVGGLTAIPVELLSTRFSDTLDICCIVSNFKKTI